LYANKPTQRPTTPPSSPPPMATTYPSTSKPPSSAPRAAAISMSLGAGRGWGSGAADVVVTYKMADISYETTVGVGKGGGRDIDILDSNLFLRSRTR
jgi:hypothetical protein